MRFVYTKAGEPLEELAARAYEFEDESAAKVRAAGRALRDANPFLRKLSDVPEATLLVVPELEGAAPARATEPLEGAVGTLVVGRLKEAATQAVELLAQELDEEVADARSSLEVLRSSEARRLVTADDEAKRIHEATRNAVKARLAAADRLDDHRKQVAAQVEKDLEELLGALGMSGSGA